MKIIFISILVFASSLHALEVEEAPEVEVTCVNAEKTKSIVISHNLADTKAKFVVLDSEESELGSGDFDSLVSGVDSFLNLLFVGYSKGESSVVGLTLLDITKENLSVLENGEYEAESDLFVQYSETGFIDGSTLDCTVRIERSEKI